LRDAEVQSKVNIEVIEGVLFHWRKTPGIVIELNIVYNWIIFLVLHVVILVALGQFLHYF